VIGAIAVSFVAGVASLVLVYMITTSFAPAHSAESDKSGDSLSPADPRKMRKLGYTPSDFVAKMEPRPEALGSARSLIRRKEGPKPDSREGALLPPPRSSEPRTSPELPLDSKTVPSTLRGTESAPGPAGEGLEGSTAEQDLQAAVAWMREALPAVKGIAEGLAPDPARPQDPKALLGKIDAFERKREEAKAIYDRIRGGTAPTETLEPRLQALAGMLDSIRSQIGGPKFARSLVQADLLVRDAAPLAQAVLGQTEPAPDNAARQALLRKAQEATEKLLEARRLCGAVESEAPLKDPIDQRVRKIDEWVRSIDLKLSTLKSPPKD
jgi:hypothetical protein